MVGPSPFARGGISAVVQSYLASTLVERVRLKYLATNVDGNKFRKALAAVKAFVMFPFICLFFRPDLVHIHFAEDTSCYRKAVILFLAKLMRKKVVGHCHAANFDKFHDASFVNRILLTRFLNNLDMIIVLSTSWQRLVLTYTENRKTVILYNPVNYAIFQDSRPWEHDSSVMTILFAGRIGARKGTFDILNAIPAIITQFPDVRFIFAGDGEVKKVTEIAKKMGIQDNTFFPGWISGAEKYRFFMDADIYLLPSYEEGIPVSILEAMAAGLPIITTAIGGIPDAVEDGVNGYFVSPGDSGAIARKTIQLLGAPALRKEIGLNNKNKIKEIFDINGIVEQLLTVYGSLLHSELTAALQVPGPNLEHKGELE